MSNIGAFKSDLKNIKTTISELEKQILETDKRKKKSYEDFLDEILTKDEYLAFKSKCEQKSIVLKQNIDNLNNQICNENSIMATYNQWVERFKNYIDVNALDRNIIVELVERITINSDGTLYIKFKFENPYKSSHS